MKREDAIQKFLQAINKTDMAAIVRTLSATAPYNHSLQLLNTSLSSYFDPHYNWFTALAVLCIYQRRLAGKVIQQANLVAGNSPLTQVQKKRIIDAVANGAKLTKADAG